MDHAEALERIEIAAAEPQGLERLMAGDTPDAAAVAGHLAGCPECAAELAAIRRVALVVGEAIRSQPDPELRERTLAYVREVGRVRGPGAPDAAGAAAGGALVDLPARGTGAPGRGARQRLPFAWTAGIAAMLVIAVAGAFLAGGVLRDDRGAEVALLERTTAATLRVEARPDARRVELAAADGGDATGSLLFSPGSGELVVVATGLEVPGQGREYGCWVEADGVRTRIGRMYFAGDLATWAGDVPGLAGLPAGAVFGVSLGPVGGGETTPVLTGQL